MSLIKKVGFLIKIGLFITIVFPSCMNKKIISNNEECKEYYAFIKKNWKNENGIYHFQDYPDYWKESIYDTYVKESCLLGLKKDEIIKIFGEPTIIFQNPRIGIYTYCMSTQCFNSKIMGSGNRLDITFDEKGLVKFISTSPFKNDL